MGSFRWGMATIVAGLLLISGVVSAQQSTGSTTMTTVSSADMDFAKTAAGSGNAEVDLGKLATQKASDQSVKTFGQQMVDDHRKANDQLMKIAQTKKIDLPTDLPAEAKTAKDHLNGMSGADFDREFMIMMLSDHKKAVDLFTKESQSGQDAELKQFAQTTLPTLQSHLQQAQQIDASLRKVAGNQGVEQQTNPTAGGGEATGGSTQPQQQAAVPTSKLGEKTAKDLIGRTVVNEKGEKLGSIDDVVMNSKDKAVLAVVSVGGFLGIGAKDVAIPFEQLAPGDNGNILVSSAVTKDQLKSMPEYKKGAAGYEAYPSDKPISGNTQ
jgi:putative membrane protein